MMTEIPFAKHVSHNVKDVSKSDRDVLHAQILFHRFRIVWIAQSHIIIRTMAVIIAANNALDALNTLTNASSVTTTILFLLIASKIYKLYAFSIVINAIKSMINV